jgi:hypothetical protein
MSQNSSKNLEKRPSEEKSVHKIQFSNQSPCVRVRFPRKNEFLPDFSDRDSDFIEIIKEYKELIP